MIAPHPISPVVHHAVSRVAVSSRFHGEEKVVGLYELHHFLHIIGCGRKGGHIRFVSFVEPEEQSDERKVVSCVER